MKYVVQINTGSLNQKVYDASAIIDRLEYVCKFIDISRVIIGWNDDYDNNAKIVNYLNSKNIESYFWLPVFAEIIDDTKEHKYVGDFIETNKNEQLYSDDTFEFVCQSSKKNIDFITDKFSNIVKDIKFTGVFLDRIRYKSAANNANALFGCNCDDCRKLYEENGIDIDKLRSCDYKQIFVPTSICNGVYQYEDKQVDKLMSLKRNIISKQIERLSAYFRTHGLKVGADTFALSLADFVGQDLFEINKNVDFIKTMNYCCTTAPAGLPYELSVLGDKIVGSLENIWNNKIDCVDETINETKYLKQANIKVTPGIDTIWVDNICHSTPDYVLENVKKLAEIGIDEMSLSWNAMLITDELLNKLSQLNK